MSRAAEATINLSALKSNLARVRTKAPGNKIVAVIKANGYGHGIVRVARALIDAADAFAVASIDEALILRQAGISKPLLLLEGFFGIDELVIIQQQKLSIVIHQEEQLALLERLAADQGEDQPPLSVWLKIDTGMNRLGFTPPRLPEIFERLHQCPLVATPITVMTHLANADDRQDRATIVQLELMEKCIRNLPEAIDISVSVANSSGIMGWPDSHKAGSQTHWSRPGIMLYGVSPFIDSTASADGLKPVMTLRSRIIAIKSLSAGDKVGYGGTWQCPEAMPLGVVAIGYGDGYPRSIQPNTPVLVRGQRLPIVGRVSMDMITIDLRLCPDAVVGEEVVLWGEGLPVEEIASAAGTIAYELLCGVTSRVRKIEISDDE